MVSEFLTVLCFVGMLDNLSGCLTSFLNSVASEPVLLPPCSSVESLCTPEPAEVAGIKGAWLENEQYSCLQDSFLGFILETLLRAVFLNCPHLMEW